MTAEALTRHSPNDLQARWDRAEQDRRAAARDLADARRRKQRAAEIQNALQAEADRLGLRLVITRP